MFPMQVPTTFTPEQAAMFRRSGDLQDQVYDLIQEWADSLYEEAQQCYGETADKADLAIRAILSRLGTEMAHDWQYGPTAP